MHDRESEATLRRLLRIHDSVDELGLREILPEVQGYSFISLLSEADHLAIVMNDGHRWVGNHSVALQARFSTSSETEFFLVDPDSPFVESLAKKTSTTVDDLKKKIRETYVLIEAAYKNSEKKGRVTIYRIATYPTKSMFFSESKLIETPYQTASGRAQIPVFEYQKVARQDSPYSFAERDIKAMRGESQVEKRLGHGEES